MLTLLLALNSVPSIPPERCGVQADGGTASNRSTTVSRLKMSRRNQFESRPTSFLPI